MSNERGIMTDKEKVECINEIMKKSQGLCDDAQSEMYIFSEYIAGLRKMTLVACNIIQSYKR